jgi:hypothetical protein
LTSTPPDFNTWTVSMPSMTRATMTKANMTNTGNRPPNATQGRITAIPRNVNMRYVEARDMQRYNKQNVYSH